MREQALRDEGAVEPDERHHVADRAERHEVEPLQQVRLRPSAPIPAARAGARRLTATTRQEGHADGGKVAQAGEVVLPVRVDDRHRRRQLGADLVMVEHDARRGPARAPSRAPRGWSSRSRRRRSAARRRRRACASPRYSARSPRRGGRGCRSSGRGPDRAGSARAAPPRSRRRRRSRRRSRPSRPPTTASAIRAAAASMSVSTDGSGSSALQRSASRKCGASSGATPRPASTRATMSGTPCRWAMASAVAAPRHRRAASPSAGRSASARRRGRRGLGRGGQRS